MSVSRPGIVHVRSWEDAEERAAEWLRFFGFEDAQVTPAGRDGGLDVVSRGAVAQVKFRGAHSGRPEVQGLVGAVGRGSQRELFFFAASGFSKDAVAFADEEGVALFVLGPYGDVEPAGRVGRGVLAAAERRASELTFGGAEVADPWEDEEDEVSVGASPVTPEKAVKEPAADPEIGRVPEFFVGLVVCLVPGVLLAWGTMSYFIDVWSKESNREGEAVIGGVILSSVGVVVFVGAVIWALIGLFGIWSAVTGRGHRRSP